MPKNFLELSFDPSLRRASVISLQVPRPRRVSTTTSEKRKKIAQKIRRAFHKVRVQHFVDSSKPKSSELQIWLEAHGLPGKIAWKIMEKIKVLLVYFGLVSLNKPPIKRRINERHLELEPLCCLSSCLVRCGCMSVLVFEIIYVFVSTLVIILKLKPIGGRPKLWEPFEANFNDLVTHQLFLYIVLGFNVVTLIAVLILLNGLLTFERNYVKFHYRYDFLALFFNMVAFIVYLLALSSEGPETFTFDNIVLLLCFFGQLPLQLWAISVVKSCYDFYKMLHVFISIAETQIAVDNFRNNM